MNGFTEFPVLNQDSFTAVLRMKHGTGTYSCLAWRAAPLSPHLPGWSLALFVVPAGTRPLRIVVARAPSGRRKNDYFFSTDLSLLTKGILGLSAQRRPLEVAFCSPMQLLGLEGPENRTPKAVKKT